MDEAFDITRSSAVATAGGWREGIVVLALVLAPMALAVLLVSLGLIVVAGWQILHGMPVRLPGAATLQSYGQLAYIAGLWIDVVLVWLWSSRRGLRRDVFLFHRLTWPALAAGIAGFVIAMYSAPAMVHLLSGITGGRGPGVHIDFRDAQSIALYLLLFVISSPFIEETLYRGLLVDWLRRVGWSAPAIWLAGSVLFGANHVLPLGFVWGIVMTGLGAILFSLRLRYESLTPAWLAHVLFNAQPFIALPLINWLAPALHPGFLV
jgi:membrane protease YdiL (CAAX protease family)